MPPHRHVERKFERPISNLHILPLPVEFILTILFIIYHAITAITTKKIYSEETKGNVCGAISITLLGLHGNTNYRALFSSKSPGVRLSSPRTRRRFRFHSFNWLNCQFRESDLNSSAEAWLRVSFTGTLYTFIS